MRIRTPYKNIPTKLRGLTEDMLCEELLNNWGKFKVYKELTNKKSIDIQLEKNAMTIVLEFDLEEWEEISKLIISEDYSQLYRTLHHYTKYRQGQLVVEKI